MKTHMLFPDKLEYKVFYPVNGMLSDELNWEGLDGWELVSVVQSHQKDQYIYYFKRRIPRPENPSTVKKFLAKLKSLLPLKLHEN